MRSGYTSKSQSRSWKAVEFGMMEVSWPLSTVPTKEKVRCRMWLLSSERFFFSSMASNYTQTKREAILPVTVLRATQVIERYHFIL